jgi:hypothetical protein
MTASELRNVVSRPLAAMAAQSILSRHTDGFADQRLKLGEDDTDPINRDMGSDEAFITNA